MEGTTSGQLLPIIRANISKEAFIVSDEWKVYGALGKEYWMHQTVNHSIGEYVRGIVHTNTVEGFYSIFKRGMKGSIPTLQGKASAPLPCRVRFSVQQSRCARH